MTRRPYPFWVGQQASLFQSWQWALGDSQRVKALWSGQGYTSGGVSCVNHKGDAISAWEETSSCLVIPINSLLPCNFGLNLSRLHPDSWKYKYHRQRERGTHRPLSPSLSVPLCVCSNSLLIYIKGQLWTQVYINPWIVTYSMHTISWGSLLCHASS